MQEKTLSFLRDTLSKESCDAVLLSSPSHLSYITGYQGFSPIEREAYLLITREKQFILTDGRYTTAVKKAIPSFSLCEITGETPFSLLLKDLVAHEHIHSLGFESTNLTVAEYTQIKKTVPKMKALDLRSLRIQKTQDEVMKIAKACLFGDKIYRYIQTKLQKGVTEEEIARGMELYAKRFGSSLSFPSIVAFGENAAVPHHLTSQRKLKEKDFVLLDFGTKVDNYCSDMTRTVVFGEPTDRQKKMHATVLEAQESAITFTTSRLKKNEIVRASEIDKKARTYIESKGYSTIPHSLGHGIGVEVHEAPSLSPKSKDILTDGMVFSIEPGIYIPGFGGVRIEDLFAIHNGKLIQLTKSPKGIEQPQ